MKKNKNLKQTTPENILNRIEFHREAVALLPDLTDKKPGVAFMQRDPKFKSVKRFCTCTVSGSKTCTHLKELTRVFKTIQKSTIKPIEEDFKTSIWYRLPSILAEGSRETPQSVQLKLYFCGDKKILKVFGSNVDEILHTFPRGLTAPVSLSVAEICRMMRRFPTEALSLKSWPS